MPRTTKHRLFVGRTQSGKTSQMLTGLDQILSVEVARNGAPVTGLTVIDAKGSALWLGAGTTTDKDGSPGFLWVPPNDFEAVLAAQRKLEYLAYQMLPHRAKTRMTCLSRGADYRPRPHILIIEEWLILLDRVRTYDALYVPKGGKKLEPWFINTVITLLISGLEDGLEVWLSTQDPTTDVNRLSPNCRESLTFNCFGGPARGYGSLTAAIKNPYLVPAADRADLSKRLKTAQNQRLWVVLSNDPDLAGQSEGDDLWNIYLAPQIDPRIKQKVLFRGDCPERLIPQTSDFAALRRPLTPQNSEVESQDAQESNVVPLRPAEVVEPDEIEEAVQRLIRYAERRGEPFKLQEAQVGLPSPWGRAEIVRQAAQIAAQRGLATLKPNKYPNSFTFTLVATEALCP